MEDNKDTIFNNGEIARDFLEINQYVDPIASIGAQLNNQRAVKQQQIDEYDATEEDGLFDTIANIWRQANVQGHNVNLNKKLQEYSDSEGKWLPELRYAEEYLQNKEQIRSLQSQLYYDADDWSDSQKQATNNEIDQLKTRNELLEYGIDNGPEPFVGLRTLARTNPYLRDIFYDTNYKPFGKNAIRESGKDTFSLADRLKIQFYDFISGTYIDDINPNNNLSHYISEAGVNTIFGKVGGPTQEQLDYLWEARNNDRSLDTQIQQLNDAIRVAEAKEYTKRSDIAAKINTIKKGNLLFDPTKISPTFKRKYEQYKEEGLEFSNLESWVYAMPELGSSFTEIGAMLGSMAASSIMHSAAKGALTAATGGTFPLLYALTEAGVNYGIQEYMRDSETKSEIFDASSMRALQQINENNIPLNSIIEQYKPILLEKGYPVESMTDQEIFNLTLIDPEPLQVQIESGITPEKSAMFNTIKQEVQDDADQAVIRQTNMALSIPDYLMNMWAFSYGGKYLKSMHGLSTIRKGSTMNDRVAGTAYERALNTAYDAIPKTGKLGRLQDLGNKVIDKTIVKNFERIAKNPMTRVSVNRVFKGIANTGKTLGLSYFNERNEEGIQNIVSNRYQKGEYDNVQNYTLLDGLANSLQLGVEANLAYYGIHPDESLNTDKDLRNAMDVGGFTGLFLTGIYSAPNSLDLYKQVLTDQKLRGLVADRYGDAERDNKVEAFVKAGNQDGKNFARIRESLQSLKQHKPEGVTDEMIDEDITLAENVSYWLNNRTFKKMADAVGAKKGSKERTYMLQNLIDLQQRTNEQGVVTNEVASQLESLIQDLLGGSNKDFDFALGREYSGYVKRKRPSAKKQQEINKLSKRAAELQQTIREIEASTADWSEIDKKAEKYRNELASVQARQNEISADLQSDPISYDQYKRNIVNQIITVRSYKLLKQLQTELQNRKNDLQKLAKEKHLDVNLEGISGISSYIDSFLKQQKPFIDRLVSDAKKQNPDITEDSFLDLASERYTLPKQEEFDNILISRAVNAGVYNDLLNHLSAYREGVYAGDMRLYNHTFDNLTAQEQAEISITPQEYDQRYAESETQNEMDEAADSVSKYVKQAERVIERDLARRQAKINQAFQETLEDNGTPVDQPVAEPIDEQTAEPQSPISNEEQADTGHSNGQEEPQTAAVDIDTSMMEEEQKPSDETKNKLEAEINALEESLGQTDRTPEQTTLEEEELQEYESSVPVEQVQEEAANNLADASSEQDAIRVKEEFVEEVTKNEESTTVDRVEETTQTSTEDSATEEKQEDKSSVQEEKEEQSTEPKAKIDEVPVPPTSNKATVPPVVDVPNPLNDIPTNDELFIDPATDQLMYDPSGQGDIQNAVTVEDAMMQIQNEFETTIEDYVMGPAAHQKHTANSDEINPSETSAKQKKRYIASTFFYPPMTKEVMPIQNYGNAVELVTKDGKKAVRGSGAELAELLAIPGWVNSIDDAYYIITASTHDMSSADAIDNLAVHLIIEKDGKVYNASLRAITPKLRQELLGTGMTEADVETQINKLRQFRNQIIKLYYPEFFQGKALPTTVLKHVKPINMRISNGSLDNQINQQGLPEFRLLTEVEDFAIPSDPQELTEALQNPDSENGVEIGFGAGPFATNNEPFSIQRLDQSGETSVQGRGYAGKLYYIPKVENTPSGRNTLPIMLAEELHRIPEAKNYTEIELSVNADGTVNKGVMPTTAELIFNLMTGVYSQLPREVSQFLLDLLANSGPRTSTAGFDEEQSNRFNFLVRKQLLTFETKDTNGNVIRKGLITSEPRRHGAPQYGYQPYITNLLKLDNNSKKRAIWNISQNIHWNTDKDLLMSEFPQEFVDMLIRTYERYSGKKDENTQFPVFSRELIFSLNDIGYTIKDGRVVKKEGTSPIVASWYINHGKIKTDLGNHAFFAPFVYTDGGRVSQPIKSDEQVTKPTKKVTTSGKIIETRTPATPTVEKPVEQQKATANKPTVALAATPENLQKYGLEIPSNMKAPVGQKWAIVPDKQKGGYKVTLAPAKFVQGFTSTERGEGNFKRETALKWLEDTLGITPENTDILVVNAIASTLSDARVYGLMRVAADSISGQLNPQFIFSNDAGKGIEYHEAFHYVTQLLLNRQQRAALYAEYERRHPSDTPRTKREVEELLAEEFRKYMLDQQHPTVGYKIVKFFKNILSYIKTLFGRVNMQDVLFRQIAKGKFKNYKPDAATLKEFYDTYEQGLYYYIPGLTKEEVEKMPNIVDGNTFYKVVDSLTSTILTMYKIRNLNDVRNLSIQGIFDQIQERLDQNWIDENNIPLVQDVLNNKDIFRKYILRKLRSLSIRESDTLEAEEDARLETETGDNPDNNWDKNQGDHSKKKNVAFQAKLFFYSVPQYEWTFVEHEDGTVTKEAEPQYDDIFGFNIAESFNVVWNKIMDNLWNINTYQDILNEVARLAKTDKTFYALDQMLNDPENPIDDNTKTQLEVTIKSFKAEFNTINVTHERVPAQGTMSDEEYQSVVKSALSKSIWEVRSSKNLRRVSLYPRAWSNAFFASSSVISDEEGNKHINKGLIDFITTRRSAINKYIRPFTDKKFKGKKLEGEQLEVALQDMKDKFIQICNSLSIPFDAPSLERTLDEIQPTKSISGNIDFDRFITLWSSDISRNKSFSNILENLVAMSNKKNATIKSRGASYVRTADRLFTYFDYEAAINKMARAYGAVHPSQQEFSVIGADGALVYSISENNYTNDQIRNINQNTNGKLDQILNIPYSKRSLIANAAKNGVKFQLNSLLMVKTENDPGRDYFGISPIEDYITKLVLTFNDQMTLPTMSDKKTWYSITGLSLVKDIVRSQRVSTIADFTSDTAEVSYEPISRRFSQSTLNTFANIFLDEFDAVWDYYVHKEYVAKHPKERIDNYHGKIKNGVMQPGGNGGRFRYFSSIAFNGERYDLNHTLAKLETEDTTEAVLKYLKDMKMLLFKSDNFEKVSDLEQDSMIFDAVNNFLVDATNRELKALKARGVVKQNVEGGYYSNNLIPYSVISYYRKELGDRDYSKQDFALKEEDAIFSAIGSHVANTMISIIEFEKCVTGDPAYYKHKTMKVTEDSDINVGDTVTFMVDTGRDVDKIKRLSAVLSTGTNLRTVWDDPKENNRTISVLTLQDNQIGSSFEEELRNIFRNSLLRDIYSRKHPTLNDDQIIEALSTKEKEDEFYDSLTKDEQKYVDDNTENSVFPYTFEKDDKGNPDYSKGGSINQSDAAVYIRPAMYRRIMKALGNWSDEIEEAYAIMEGEDESWMSDPKQYIKVTSALAQPLKMVYFGDHFRKNTNLNVPIFDKMAMFPLFKALAKADNRLLYDRMNNEELGVIDMVAFESSVKVGGTPKFQAYEDSNNETFNLKDLNKPSYNKTGKEDSLPVYNQDIVNLRLQLNTEPHEALDRAFGTQATKICLANLIDDRTYGLNKGKKIKGKQLKKQVMEAINQLTQRGKMDILKRFFKDHNVKNEALSEYLVSQAIDSNMPESFTEGLGLDESGEFIIPLEATSNRRWIESRLISYVNKTVVDINTRGGAAIQMSSFGFKATGPRKQSAIGTAFNDGKPLSFLRKDGSMEVMLSTNFFRHIVPKEFQGSYGQMRKWLIDHNIIGNNAKPIGVGYRIPTQGLSSTFSFVVADVIPDRFGDTVVVPDEFTAMTGSDFDVDKLYIAMLNTDNDGNIIQYEQGKDVTKQSVEALQNMVIQSYQTVISDSSNMAETRASIDTLTQLLQKEILPKVKPGSKTEALPAYELLPSFQLARKEEYTSGKAGIGPFALNSTNHALTQFVHLNMQYSQGNPYRLRQLDEITGRDGYRILDWLSAMINAHVDVAKDPYVITLNVNSVTYNITNLLLRGGMGKTTFYFLAQPVLKRFANTVLANNGIYGAQNIKQNQLLGQLRLEYATALKQQIDALEEGSSKSEWMRRFNDVVFRYSIKGIQQYDIVSDNFKSTANEDTFNEDMLSKALTDKDSINSNYQQLLVLNAYQVLSEDAERLSRLVNRSQIDTKKYGNTLATQMNFNNSYNTFIEDDGQFFSIRGEEYKDYKRPLMIYFNRTFLAKKLDFGTSLPREILKDQLLSATSCYRDIFCSVMGSLFGRKTISLQNGGEALAYKHQGDKKKVNTIAQYISSIIRARLVKNIPQLTASDEEIRSMFYGSNTMCKVWAGLKAYIRENKDKFPDLIAQDGTFKNPLLDYLQEYPADGSQTFVDRIIPAEATMNNDADVDNRLTTAFADLLYHEDEMIRMVANDLAKYAYLTSYDERGRNTFFNLVPNQWKIEVGYISAIKDALQQFKGQDNSLAYQMVAEEIDNYNSLEFPSIAMSIARNMWDDESIVPTIPFSERYYDSETRKYYGDERTLFYSKIKVGKRYVRVSDAFITPDSKTSGRDFIKVSFLGGANRVTELYQKVGYVGYTNEEGKTTRLSPVYRRIPKLGFKDNDTRVLELGKDSIEMSAFTVNAFEETSIYDEGTIQNAALSKLTDLSSKGLQKFYISAEANSVNTKVADRTSDVLDATGRVGVDNNIDVTDMSNSNSQDFVSDEALAKLEAETSDFVNVSITDGVQNLVEDMQDAMDVMNQIDISQSTPTDMGQEQVEAMDMSMFTAGATPVEAADMAQFTEDKSSSNKTMNIWYSSNENKSLSNMAKRPFTYNGVTYNTVEGAFQAAKLNYSNAYSEAQKEALRKKFSTATGASAKTLGRSIKGLNKTEWDKASSGIMKELIKQSFDQNPDAKRSLLATGNATFTHNQESKTSKWRTEFPRILMEVRSEFRTQQQRVSEEPIQMSIEAMDMSELTAMGKKRKEQCK